jgi:dTDP-4-amino-4,6-dideoxygalactose transaminase
VARAVLAGAEMIDDGDVIRFNKPALEGNEMAYVETAVETGHTSCSGPYATTAAGLLNDWLGSSAVLLTTSCTAALEMSALLLDLQPGDTVVVPSFTFTSTALAFLRTGARILFCDIERETLGLDPGHLATLLDDSVRAVVPVHYAGVGCDMAGIQAAIAGRDVAIVEDNAHGLFGTYRGKPLGSLGRFATLSFHETKNFICGEGGALIVNDPRDVNRAWTLYDKGTNRREFMLGEVDKYSWHDIGGSFGLSEVLAAFLYAQLERRDVILAKRRAVFDSYMQMLSPLADELGLELPIVPADREQAYHMFYVLLPDRATRDAALESMRAQGVQPTFHYVPLHSAPAAQRFAARQTECPVTDDVSDRLLRLPFHNNLAIDDIARVVNSLCNALARIGAE